VKPLLPMLDFGLLRNLRSVINPDPKISNSALYFDMTEQESTESIQRAHRH